jgi:hypothetical protein
MSEGKIDVGGRLVQAATGASFRVTLCPRRSSLFDEASCLAFGVVLGVVVGAEVVVELAGVEHVPDRAEH